MMKKITYGKGEYSHCIDIEPILKSEKDKQIFFDILQNPREPNQNLINAAKEYKKYIENAK